MKTFDEWIAGTEGKMVLIKVSVSQAGGMRAAYEEGSKRTEQEETCLPWHSLEGWDIVGMNHYHVEGKRHLYVAMMKEDRIIKAEGRDEKKVFKRLKDQARIPQLEKD